MTHPDNGSAVPCAHAAHHIEQDQDQPTEAGDHVVSDGVWGTAIPCPGCSGAALVLDPDELQPGPPPPGYPTEADADLEDDVDEAARIREHAAPHLATSTAANPMDVVTARTAAYRLVLEAIAVQGLDPAQATVTMNLGDQPVIHAAPDATDTTRGQAFGILAALTGIKSPDDMHRRDLFGSGHRPCSSYSAGNCVVFAELHPDAREPEASTGEPA